MGALGTAAISRMEERLPWFRTMSAANRSWIGLVAQAGIAAFVDWFKNPTKRLHLTVDIFGTAPRELTRAVTLQQTVELVRVVIDVVESRVDELAEPGGEDELREAVLLYTRDVAFAAAQVYARAAEARGAWDARLEALVVDALLRGDTHDGLHSWAAALGWNATSAAVLAGHAPDGESEAVVDDVQRAGRHAKLDVLAGVQGRRLMVIVGGAEDLLEASRPLVAKFGPGPVVIGPTVPDLHAATRSARDALAGLRAVVAWPDAPRPVLAEDLLAERALAGDDEARRQLVERVYVPLRDADVPLLDTLTTYLLHGASLEAAARLLFVHPNTVRYRLRRIAEMTGYQPAEGRSGFVLTVALALGRLADSDEQL
ncbi:MAG: PucR family transcriptional regulator [Streptosporangiales bacterium]|nr:PucR family transcriptional regulator [Streptosporangiales bacterium]